jgi:hypothetical protein
MYFEGPVVGNCFGQIANFTLKLFFPLAHRREFVGQAAKRLAQLTPELLDGQIDSVQRQSEGVTHRRSKPQ